MIWARRRALGILVVVALAGAAFALARSRHEAFGPRPASERPTLLLLTSLPLMWGEDFSLKGGGTEALRRLQGRYRVLPISVTSASELARGKLLLMAQPLAQTPENLVALDHWVWAGGRVLLLADPLLEWPSRRPLGDILRPPPMFADTGLLAHWGLRLDAPDERGAVERKLGGFDIIAVSPGRLSGHCAVSGDGLVADCRVGKGRAVVVADADVLNIERLGPGARRNLDAIVQELGTLERK
jgi:hypothetical protein